MPKEDLKTREELTLSEAQRVAERFGLPVRPDGMVFAPPEPPPPHFVPLRNEIHSKLKVTLYHVIPHQSAGGTLDQGEKFRAWFKLSCHNFNDTFHLQYDDVKITITQGKYAYPDYPNRIKEINFPRVNSLEGSYWFVVNFVAKTKAEAGPPTEGREWFATVRINAQLNPASLLGVWKTNFFWTEIRED